MFVPVNEAGFQFREFGKHDAFHLSQRFKPPVDLLVLQFFRIGICGGGGDEFGNSFLCFAKPFLPFIRDDVIVNARRNAAQRCVFKRDFLDLAQNLYCRLCA